MLDELLSRRRARRTAEIRALARNNLDALHCRPRDMLRINERVLAQLECMNGNTRMQVEQETDLAAQEAIAPLAHLLIILDVSGASFDGSP